MTYAQQTQQPAKKLNWARQHPHACPSTGKGFCGKEGRVRTKLPSQLPSWPRASPRADRAVDSAWETGRRTRSSLHSLRATLAVTHPFSPVSSEQSPEKFEADTRGRILVTRDRRVHAACQDRSPSIGFSGVHARERASGACGGRGLTHRGWGGYRARAGPPK